MIALIALALGQAAPPAQPPQVALPPMADSITAAEAAAMVAACEGLASASGWSIQIAILNSSGDLIRFTKMDGSRRTSTVIARAKAESAFKTGRTTRDLGISPTIAAPLLGGLVVVAGGVPIVRNGLLAGAVGVSGASADQDEVCAVAAIATLRR